MNDLKSSGRLLTIAEAAQMLTKSPKTLRHWLRSGKVEGYKIGGEWRMSKEYIDEFIENAKRPPK